MKKNNFLGLFLLASFFYSVLYAPTDTSKAMASYIGAHIKTATTPLPDTLKKKAADMTLLEDFLKGGVISLEKIPTALIEKCKDLDFREALLALVPILKIKIVSDDKTIETIIQKLNEKDLYTYLSAKIDLMLSNNDAFKVTIKAASQEVKDFVLLELLLNTASEFGTTKDYQKTQDFKKNEAFITLTTDAGAKIDSIVSKIQTLGLTAAQQEIFINALFAPHFDFIEFLIKNGMNKNLTLQITPQKKQTLAEFYDEQVTTATEKLKNVVSTDLNNTLQESQKILALLKPTPTKPAPAPTAPAKTA